eukprot:9491803-Pyramimonas_sp.AAC.1
MCHHPNHRDCQIWQRIALIPGQDTDRCGLWLSKQSDYRDEVAHLAAWNEIVLGIAPAGAAPAAAPA